MISWQQLYLFVKTAFRLSKGPRREQAAFFVAALCFSGGFALVNFAPDFVSGKWIKGLQIGLYAIGAIAFIYGAERVWRLVNPPELEPVKNRPSAIKGPMAFTEADGELFRKLGRENELRKLLGLVQDEQTLMIVVRGASGAGKTSLLRAGLKDILGNGAVFHYWEAMPVEPDKGLLRAIQEKWPEGAAKPTTLAELVNPSDALGRQSHVIVLDQFEQLRGNRKIFQLLRRIVRESRPPHRITWVIAFRREFSADWLDFISPEQENGVRPPQDVPLRLFTADQAREVIGQLINESNLKDSIEQSVINNLVEAATVENEVSPVDIGIGLLVLTELHERQSGQTITIRDYQFAGGAEGLLTQYISRCLEPFPKESQEAILKAMLALRDPEENRQRRATGLTIDELAAEAGTDARVLKLQLNRLADRDMRLLEVETPTDGSAMRYRLPHERLIPALYRLTGKLLAEVDQAKLKFQNAFQAWQTNDKRSRYLLKGKELRLVQRYETQIPWGQAEQEKKRFLFQSKRRRQFVRASAVAGVLVLIGAGVLTRFQIQQIQVRNQQLRHKEFLRDEGGYPAELYDLQHQLKKLELTEPLNLERFTWLSPDSTIEELSLTAASSSNSIAGLTSLAKCRALKGLTLILWESQIRDLEPLAQLQGLTKLVLGLSDSQVNNLKPLEQLKGLQQLSLKIDDGQANKLQFLEQLDGLQELTLELDTSVAYDLKPLEQLKGLRRLTLRADLDNLDLKPLEQLNGLTHLVLEVSGPGSKLKSLERLTSLQQLSITISSKSIVDLTFLRPLEQLEQLALNVYGEEAIELGSLEPLKGLQQLTLSVRNLESELTFLEQLKIQQLTLGVSAAEVHRLKPLEQLKELSISFDHSLPNDWKFPEHLTGLQQLTLFFEFDSVGGIEFLKELKELQQLEIFWSSLAGAFPSLGRLNKLQYLSLHLHHNWMRGLETLEQLKGLQYLELDLRETQIFELTPLERLNQLQGLALNLDDSEVRDLKPLEQLKELTTLSLRLKNSKVINLESVQKLSLETLSIDGATRAQRLSLRNLPPSLVELRF